VNTVCMFFCVKLKECRFDFFSKEGERAARVCRVENKHTNHDQAQERRFCVLSHDISQASDEERQHKGGGVVYDSDEEKSWNSQVSYDSDGGRVSSSSWDPDNLALDNTEEWPWEVAPGDEDMRQSDVSENIFNDSEDDSESKNIASANDGHEAHGKKNEAANRLLYAWRMKMARNLKLQAQETRASQRESGEHTESDESLDE
jgi:hypothetical protein